MQRLAPVALEQPLVAGLVEGVVDRQVAEVEVAVAHARVLPVEDPHRLAVVDQVRRAAGRCGRAPARAPGAPGRSRPGSGARPRAGRRTRPARRRRARRRCARSGRPRPRARSGCAEARVEVAVGRQPRRAEHAVGDHQREALLRLVSRQQLERQPERLRPAGLPPRLLPARLRRRQPQPAALDPAAVERAVELDRVHHHPRQRDRAAELADEPGRVERRAGGELIAVDQHHVLPAQLGEVVGDRAAAHAPADDHAACRPGKVTRHAARPRARRRSAGPRTPPGRARSAPARTRRSRSRAPRSPSARRPTSPRAGPT